VALSIFYFVIGIIDIIVGGLGDHYSEYFPYLMTWILHLVFSISNIFTNRYLTKFIEKVQEVEEKG